MNKDEMINDMRAIIRRERSDCMSNLCENCEYYAMNFCGSTKTATALYNANYRKVGDDEIVIKTDIECVDNTTPANVIEFFVKHNAEVRQETAREILLQIEHDSVEYPVLTIFEIIDRIADKYDVNLEDCHAQR